MTFFSFRAECPSDVKHFQDTCAAAGITIALAAFPDDEFPDVEIEMESAASLETLRNAMREVVDGHVMLQTLRDCRLTENSLERDYDLA
ncbi:hypothetical protein [Janthinobacterium sp. FW305-128]|uniref:hypothetical protein n=1 Tax=Janthinobacterium sp. FW305-128 TaxID=2775055 RepID=UPI001E41DB9A|nr:hypothetical protein [Janthinobacterium sp. FW305-128]MCC7684830.1 hypothetical protein [Janthinobacterium sp. FW305-128]